MSDLNYSEQSAGDQQNPEVLKKQIETISRVAENTLDKHVSFIGRILPDEAVKLRERQQKAILEEQFDYNIKAIKAFKSTQLQALDTFLEENLKVVIHREMVNSAVFSHEAMERVLHSYLNTCYKMNQMAFEKVDEISKFTNEQARERAISQLNKALDMMTSLLEEQFDYFKQKLANKTMKGRKSS